MINRSVFARHCVQEGFYAGVEPHYLLAVAELRSGIKDGADGQRIGPYRLTQAEWDARRKKPEFDLAFPPADIERWRSQISVFAVMARQAFDAFEAANNRPPSAFELYLQQFPDAPAPTLSAGLQAAFDATAELVDPAAADVLPTVSEETLIEQLGTRTTAIKSHGLPEGTVITPAAKFFHGVTALGRAVLIEWIKQLQLLLCGDDSASTEDRRKLRDAFGIGQTSGAVLLTSGLIGIGCPPAIAPLVAAIVMTRFVGSAVDVFCKKSQTLIDGLS